MPRPSTPPDLLVAKLAQAESLPERNVHMPLRKPTEKSSKTASRISKARLAAMIKNAGFNATCSYD